MRTISIDPGKKGAIVFWVNTRVIRIENMPLVAWGASKSIPDRDKVRGWVDEFAPDLIVIEKVGPRETDGRGSLAIFMIGFGIMQGVCVGYRTEYALPQKWKAYAGLINKPKIASVEKSIKKHPEAQALVEGEKNAADRGDAILIGDYWLKLKEKIK